MKKPLLSRLLLIATFSLGLPTIASADPLNGVYSILFDAPFSIWDVDEIDECKVVVEPGVNAEICTAIGGAGDQPKRPASSPETSSPIGKLQKDRPPSSRSHLSASTFMRARSSARPRSTKIPITAKIRT